MFDAGSERRQARGHGLVAGLALLILLVLGCSAETPRSTAERFWSSLADGDYAAALRASNASDESQIEPMLAQRAIVGMSFEEPLENEERARIPTQLEFAGASAPIRFDTHLVKSDDTDEEWRVDVPPTSRALSAAQFSALFESAAEAVRVGVDALGEAFEEGAREAVRAIQESMRELSELEFEGDEIERMPLPEPTPGDGEEQAP